MDDTISSPHEAIIICVYVYAAHSLTSPFNKKPRGVARVHMHMYVCMFIVCPLSQTSSHVAIRA